MIYNTEKRSEITAFLSANRERAFSLEEICVAILSDGKGRSTVFRLVSKMCEEGTIRRLTEENSRHVTYQYLGGDECSEHFHLKCRECGKMIHLDEGVSHALETRILESESFVLEDGAVLFGRCADCGRGTSSTEGACRDKRDKHEGKPREKCMGTCHGKAHGECRGYSEKR